MSDLVHVIDRNFRIMFFNKAFKQKHKKLGLDIKVIGKNPFDTYLFLPDKIRKEYMIVFRTGEMLVTEEPTKINGKEIVTETRKIPIHEGERVSLIVTVIRNITESTRLEEELQEGEEKLKPLLEGIHDVIFQVSASGAIQYVSSNIEESYGHNPKDLIGKDFKLAAPLNDDPKLLKEIKRVLSGKTVADLEVNLLNNKGKIIPTEINAIPIKKNGNIVAVQGIMRDITERIKAELALRKSEEKYRALAESSEDGILVLESTGRPLYSNKTCSKLFGKKSSALFGKEIIDIFPRKNADQILKEIQNVVHKKVVSRREHAIQRGRHIRHFAITFAPMLDKKKVISVVMTLRNITKQKRMETALKEAYIKSENERSKVAKVLKKKIVESKRAYSELQQSKDELVRTERLAFTGRIAAGIAHEIRNPLTNVAMSIRQFIKTIKPEKSRSKHVDIIMRNTERINYLITELLNCARPPRLNMRPFDVHKVLKNVLDAARPKISLRRIKVIKRFISKPSIIEIDREQIERAFLNIVINAVEAMSKEGKLIIFTEHNEEQFVVKFQDTGRGIAEEDIMKIFDPFFSSKKDGVGLGLTVCYGIIVSHGGTIEVESKWKKGSIFTVTLPIKQEIEREKERVK